MAWIQTGLNSPIWMYSVLSNPDGDLSIEGDSYQDVYNKILTGIITDVDGALKDLSERYNKALDEAVASGKVNIDDYIDPNIADKMKWNQ